MKISPEQDMRDALEVLIPGFAHLTYEAKKKILEKIFDGFVSDGKMKITGKSDAGENIYKVVKKLDNQK